MSDIKCDHTSVGVLVLRNQKLLLIERKKPPYGFAPPAGHVDDHGSFVAAARAELREEVGLEAANLRLVISGRCENPCRREGGDWHYWHIFAAEAPGAITASDDEVRSVDWKNKQDLNELAKRTEQYLAGEITESDWNNNPGLEPVWLLWLKKLGMIDTSSEEFNFPENENFDSDDEAGKHGWNWFQYHAGQRLIVFRFYLVVVAVLAAGLGASWKSLSIEAVSAFLLLVMAFSVIFWRLDERNRDLVKISEELLSNYENRLFFRTGDPTIRLTRGSALRDNRNKFVLFKMYSFKEVYRWIFGTIFSVATVTLVLVNSCPIK